MGILIVPRAVSSSFDLEDAVLWSSGVLNNQLCSFCKCLLKCPFVLYVFPQVQVYNFVSALNISAIRASLLSISVVVAATFVRSSEIFV